MEDDPPEVDVDRYVRRFGGATDPESLRQSEQRRQKLELFGRTLSSSDLRLSLDPNEGETARVIQGGRGPPEVKIPSWETPQPATDYDRPSYDMIAQRTFTIHEAGHILYTDHEAVAQELGDLPPEQREPFRSVWNALEDGAIEEQLRREFAVSEEIAVLNANFMPPSGGGEYNLLEAIHMACLDLAVFDTGQLDKLLDESDSTTTFVDEETKNTFRSDALPLVRDAASDVVTESDPVDRTDRIRDFWDDIVDLLDSDLFDEEWEPDTETIGDHSQDDSGTGQSASNLDDVDPDSVRDHIDDIIGDRDGSSSSSGDPADGTSVDDAESNASEGSDIADQDSDDGTNQSDISREQDGHTDEIADAGSEQSDDLDGGQLNNTDSDGEGDQSVPEQPVDDREGQPEGAGQNIDPDATQQASSDGAPEQDSESGAAQSSEADSDRDQDSEDSSNDAHGSDDEGSQDYETGQSSAEIDEDATQSGDQNAAASDQGDDTAEQPDTGNGSSHNSDTGENLTETSNSSDSDTDNSQGGPGGEFDPGSIAEVENRDEGVADRYSDIVDRDIELAEQNREATEDDVDQLTDVLDQIKEDSDLLEDLDVASSTEPRDAWPEVRRQARNLERILDQRLQEEQRSTTRRGLRRGSIDSRAIPQARINNPRVFEQEETPDEKEYAAVIVLDRSGSMSGDIIPAEDATMAMAYALSEIGIEVCIIDLCGSSPRLAKPFGVDLESTLDTVFTGQTGGGTPLAETLQLARERLETREETPFMIVITDGQPSSTQAYKRQLQKTEFPIIGVYIAFGHSGSALPSTIQQSADLFDRRVIVTEEAALMKELEAVCREVMF